MRVGELIEALRRYDPELDVIIFQGSDHTNRDIVSVLDGESLAQPVVVLEAFIP